MGATEANAVTESGMPFDAAGVEREASFVIETLVQGVCLADAAGAILLSNQQFRAYPAGVQHRVMRICRRAVKFFDKSPETRPRPKLYRLNLSKADRFFEVVVSPASGDGTARSGRVIALVRDVSGQERLRRKIVAIDQAGAELVRLDAQTIESMHIAERLKLLETKVVRYAHDLLHFDHFTIRVLNERNNELELVMASGLSERACSIKLYATHDNNGISGRVASSGQSYICDDAAKDPLYVFGLDQAGSSLTVPLKLFGKVQGIFNVESDRPHAFTAHDRQFAEIFGNYIAMALYILNLLLVERYTTSQKATGTVEGELAEPLNDLSAEAEALKDQALDPEVSKHIDRIIKDVDSIRKRIRNVARGPQTLLGVDESAEKTQVDPQLENKRVLVVDNEDEVASTIREVLTRRGCSVTVCTDGASAQKLLLQWQLAQDPDQGFDLVLSDINIGDATGYELFAAAKAANHAVPVILMTGFGYDPHHSIVRASQEGLQCVLFKPFQVDKLVDEVRRAVTKPSA